MITKQDDFIRKLIREELNKISHLCDLNIDELLKNYDSNIFGDFQEHIDNKGFDIKVSKSLCLGNTIIGGYLLRRLSMIEQIKIIQWLIKNTDGYKNLKFFVDKKFLMNYINKRGVFSDFLYVDKKYAGNNYAKILIDYSKTLGDYVWGFSVPNESEEYWLEKQNRIKVLEYEDSIGKVVMSVSKI